MAVMSPVRSLDTLDFAGKRCTVVGLGIGTATCIGGGETTAGVADQSRTDASPTAAAPATASRKAQSITAAASQPVCAEKYTASRPASHSATSARSGNPCTGRRPVQLGMAVSRKPVTTAAR